MFQRVTLIGNLGSDPDLRYTPGGTPVCSLSVATNEVWTDQQGQRQERTTWWRISAWGRMGEICNQYLSKGRRVYVEGTVVADPETGGPRIWTDQNGQPRASFELRAQVVKFLDGRGEDVDSGEAFDEAPAAPAPRAARSGRQATPPRRSSRRPTPPIEIDDDLEDIPF